MNPPATENYVEVFLREKCRRAKRHSERLIRLRGHTSHAEKLEVLILSIRNRMVALLMEVLKRK